MTKNLNLNIKTEQRSKWAKGGIQYIDPLDVPEVIDLIREYTYYYGIDYEKACVQKDTLLKGLIS